MFKLWLESEDVLQNFKVFNPDNMFLINGFDTFIHDIENNILYVDSSSVPHSQILRREHIENIEGNCAFGRFGEITSQNIFSMIGNFGFQFPEQYLEEGPVGIIAYWKDWINHEEESHLDVQQVEFSLSKFANNSFQKIVGTVSEKLPISGDYIVVDGMRNPHYFHQIHSQSNQVKKYSIGTFHFTSEDIRNWMGKLHFLPQTSPERHQIIQNAKMIASSHLGGQFKEFILRANIGTKKMTPTLWNKEAERQKIKSPGQKLWALNSENNLN